MIYTLRDDPCPTGGLPLSQVADNALHYRELRNGFIASDVTSANNHELTEGHWKMDDAGYRNRNGSALGYLKARVNGEDVGQIGGSGNSTGFGVFRDNAGNTIIVTDARTRNSARLNQHILPAWKRYYLKIPGGRHFWNGYQLQYRSAANLDWEVNIKNLQFKLTDGTNIMGLLDNQYTRLGDWCYNTGGGVGCYSGGRRKVMELVTYPAGQPGGLLGALEQICVRAGKRLDGIVHIHFDDPPPPTNWWDIVSTVLTVADAFTALIGVPPGTLSAVGGAIKGAVSGDLLAVVNGVAAASSAIAPKFVRSVENTVKGALDDLSNTIGLTGLLDEGAMDDKVKQLITPVMNMAGLVDDAIRDTISNIPDKKALFSLITDTIGIDEQEVLKFYNRLRRNDATIVGDLLSATGIKYGEIANVIQGINNFAVVDSLRRNLKNVGADGTYVSALRQSVMIDETITNNPLMQEILSSGSAHTLLPTIPGFSDLVATIVTDQNTLIDTIGTIDDEFFADKLKSWIGGAFGFPLGPNVLGDLTVRALISKGEAYARNGVKDFPLPATIPDALQEAFAREVGQALEGDVRVHCRDGFIFDPVECRCRKIDPNTGVVVDEDIGRVEFPSDVSATAPVVGTEILESGYSPFVAQPVVDTETEDGEPFAPGCCRSVTQSQNVTINNYPLKR